MTTRYRSPGLALFISTLFAAGVIAMLSSGLGAVLVELGPLGIGAAILVACAGLIALGYLCIYWWSRLDEAAREAHKWAWWWGGTSGTALGGVALIVLERAVLTGPLQAGRLLGQPLDSMAVGALLLILLQAAGYALAWAAWWLRRR